MSQKTVYIICGPTASGKSNFALNLGQKIGGGIINADSLQIYNALPILTSSPSHQEKEAIPHFLYNIINPQIKYNVADYIRDVTEATLECEAKSLIPIIVGGTGMYINALVDGISSIPEISQEIRGGIHEIIKREGKDYLYSLLVKYDPVMASKLKSSDTQRIARSYEIYLQTGKSILEFQSQKQEPILKNSEIKTIYLKPDRQFLYDNCNTRFLDMIEKGALEEVIKFTERYEDSLNYSPSKALGFKELKQYLEGELSLNEATMRAQTSTRNYAKRQYTWFNNQISWQKTTLEYSNFEEYKFLIT